ncbi:MAG: glycosyltransferase [Saprospiraceae bacterium]|nr:glycosyltransferase [Pyrinomonadaceae bacterium]
MTVLFYILAALLVFFSYKSFRGGLAYLKYFKSEISKPGSNFTPNASVIVPCRGLDADLKTNLSTLFRQDYPKYEVIFVIDDECDPALKVIEEVSRKDAKNAKVVIAGKASRSSQKVENLREAVLHASGDSKVFVFMDSDARPNEDWLRNLVAPLEDETIGASTGYRWFISEKPTFASELLSVWNASIASALGPNTKSNFCWGGSMAIRRDIFERLDIREKWSGTLSDDFIVTRAMNEVGLPIHFVPQALTASFGNYTFHELLEFTARQMKITRVYAPKLWRMSFFGAALFNLVLLWAFYIVIFSRANDVHFWAAIAVIVIVSFFSVGKSWLRLRAAKLALNRYEIQLDRQFWTQNTLCILAPAVFLYNSIAALCSRKLAWRGIRYEMISPKETRVIDGREK